MAENAFYAQSGGVTSVINASAAGVIDAISRANKIDKVYAGLNGIIGALKEEIIDISQESIEKLKLLKYTPAGAFGSCRYKLGDFKNNVDQYERLIDVFKAHNIHYFFYNGGGDSADTCLKISQISKSLNYPIQAIHIPKTVDNDLPITDSSPGFGSVAKYVAISTKEASLDVSSMCATSTKVFVLEVMGRHAGWIAAASGLAVSRKEELPLIVLFPEITFDSDKFIAKVQKYITEFGFCTVVVSEGIKSSDGEFLCNQGSTDAFGHAQLGGTGPVIAKLVGDRLGVKYHWAVADYLQRAARHISSETDLSHAYSVGKAAVEMATTGMNSVMPAIRRLSDAPYEWDIIAAPLDEVANIEKKLPRNFISPDGLKITDECRKYIQPLIMGESYPPYENGIPKYISLRNKIVKKKLKNSFTL